MTAPSYTFKYTAARCDGGWCYEQKKDGIEPHMLKNGDLCMIEGSWPRKLSCLYSNVPSKAHQAIQDNNIYRVTSTCYQDMKMPHPENTIELTKLSVDDTILAQLKKLFDPKNPSSLEGDFKKLCTSLESRCAYETTTTEII